MFTITFPPHLLYLIAPDNTDPANAWVVCAARRSQTTVTGQPALGDIDAWQPFLPLPDTDAAQTWAIDLAAATATDVEKWLWYPPALDDGTGLALYAVLADGVERPTDLAVFPLTSLTEDGA